MTISLPSKKSITIDAPGEIKKLNGEFVYNFYMPDETINGDPQNILPNTIRNQINQYWE